MKIGDDIMEEGYVDDVRLEDPPSILLIDDVCVLTLFRFKLRFGKVLTDLTSSHLYY